MGTFDILLIGAAGLAAAYFFNIANFKEIVNSITSQVGICLPPMVTVRSDFGTRCECATYPNC